MLVKKSAKRLANSAKVLYNKIMRGSTGVARKRAAQPVNANGRTVDQDRIQFDFQILYRLAERRLAEIRIRNITKNKE